MQYKNAKQTRPAHRASRSKVACSRLTISDNKNKAFGASRKESSLKANIQRLKRHKNHFGNV